VFARFGRVRGQPFVGIEMQVALDGKAEWPAQFANLAHADEAELLGPHPGPSPYGPACVGSKRLLPF
jgi:hypothetical protein